MPLNKIGKSSPRPAWEEISPDSSHLRTLWSRWNRLRVLGRELYRTWEKENVDDQCIKLIVPAAKRLELLKYMHDLPSSAHLGVDKTFESLKNGFYWPGIKEYVKNYCKSCHHCSARKQNKAPMGNCIVGEPFERIEIDPYQSQTLVIDTYWPCVIVSPSGRKPSQYQTRLQLLLPKLFTTISFATLDVLSKYTQIEEVILNLKYSKMYASFFK